MFSDHQRIILEIYNKKKFWKFTYMWKLNNTLLNNKWVRKEITREFRKYFEVNENKNTTC